MAFGQKIATAFVELGINMNQFDRDMSRTKQKFTSGFNDLAAAAASGFAAFGISGFLGDATKEAEKLEVLVQQFETLTGSAERAQMILSELREFRDASPFTLEQLAENTKVLLAYGIEAEKISEVQRRLGDISGGSTEKLKRLSLAYGQVQAKGRLMGQEVIQLTESGFNPLQEISRTTGRSMQDLMKSMERGEIGFDMVEEAMRSATSEGGRFFGMIDKFQGTAAGSIARLAGRFQELQVVIGEILLPAKKALVEAALKVVNAFLAMSPEMQRVMTITVAMVPPILAAVTAFKALKFAGISAAVGIRAALAATGVGVLLPLIGFVIAKFLDLSEVVQGGGVSSFGRFGEAVKKLQLAFEIFWDTVNTIFNRVMKIFKKTFGELFRQIGINLEDMKEGIMGFVEFAVDLFAEFVLDVAEWFAVIVNNWSTVQEGLTQAWEFTWSAMGDILSNFFPAAWTLVKGFVESVIEVFSDLPEAIATLFESGGDIGDALTVLLEDASANMAARSAEAFNQLLTPSGETRRLGSELQATLMKLQREKTEMERQRDLMDDATEEAEKVGDKIEEETTAFEDAAEEARDAMIELGRTGLTNFADEVQDMFLQNETDENNQAKIIDLTEGALEVERESLTVEKEIRDNLKNAAVIQIATG